MIRLINPLPVTLGHYEKEFTATLDRVGCESQVMKEGGDHNRGIYNKVVAAFRILVGRLLRPSGSSVHPQIVMWPLFGFWDAITWVYMSGRNPVAIIVHDPTPLRSQIGMGLFGRYIFRRTIEKFDISIVCHTNLAAFALKQKTGVQAQIAMHPFNQVSAVTHAPEGKCKVRVLGQYKFARDLSVLVELVEAVQAGDEYDCVFEIYGRGWPEVPGWIVHDNFLPERDFNDVLATSDCIVIPYSHFFQSGVAVRALENLVPVIGPRHEHIESLYGTKWPGLVDDETNWSAALRSVLRKPQDDLTQAAVSYQTKVDHSWNDLVRQFRARADS